VCERIVSIPTFANRASNLQRKKHETFPKLRDRKKLEEPQKVKERRFIQKKVFQTHYHRSPKYSKKKVFIAKCKPIKTIDAVASTQKLKAKHMNNREIPVQTLLWIVP